jgi:ubiquinone/menaquinone biosynthesis C-methylase UbiE
MYGHMSRCWVALIMSIADVPSSIDLRLMSDALEWCTATQKRPWRMEFFTTFAEELGKQNPPVSRVLELGSGPGFLARHLLSALPNLHMVLLDFSAAMHELAKQRLGPLVSRVEFVEGSFKDPHRCEGLTRLFDAVVTHQAVHELRHKRYALELHRQVKAVSRPGASYLVCDHFFGPNGMSHDQLYMTVDEQKAAIESAGYQSVRQILLKGGLVLHHAN